MCNYRSVQFSYIVVSDSLRPRELKHARLLCPSQFPEVCSELMSFDSVMPSNRLILCCPLLLLPSIFPSIRVFSNELALHTRWPKYWSFSISPSSDYSGLISCRIDWFGLLEVRGLSRVFSSTRIQKYQFFSAQPSLWYNSDTHT